MARRKTEIENLEAQMLSKAVSYNCFLRVSPTKKISEACATLAEAAATADRIRAENKGRDCIVYAVMPEGEPIREVPVPRAMVEAAKTAAEPAAEAPAGEEAEIPAFLRREADERRKRAADLVHIGEPVDKTPYPAPKAAKPRKAAEPKPAGKRTAALEAAKAGIMPTAPDFTAATHKPYRKKLEALVALAEAGDIYGLRAVAINPTSSSPKALAKYRDLAVIAIEARRALDQNAA